MTEHICPHCQSSNPAQNRYCGHCGTTLEPYAILPRPTTDLVITRAQLPTFPLKSIGQVAAVSLTALGIRLALVWLRRQRRQHRNAALLWDSKRSLPIPRPSWLTSREQSRFTSPSRGVLILYERIIEIWGPSSHLQQIAERWIWRRDD